MDNEQCFLSARVYVLILIIPGVSEETDCETVSHVIGTIIRKVPSDRIPNISIFLSFHEFP